MRLGHADAAQRRIDEQRIRRDPVGDFARAAVEQIGGGDLVVVPRGVSECPAAVAVTKRVHAIDARSKRVVDGDVAARIDRDPGAIQAEVVRVGRAAGGQQYMGAFDSRRALGAIEVHAHAISHARQRQALRVQAQIDAFAAEDLGDRVRDVFVFARDQPRPHLAYRDLRAEPPIHLREFQSDVAAADHQQMLRDEVDIHHARVVEQGHVARAGHIGNDGAPADVDEDARRREFAIAHLHRVRGTEARMAADDFDVARTFEPLGHAFARALHHGILARFHLGHVDTYRRVDHHPVLGCASGHMGGARAGH